MILDTQGDADGAGLAAGLIAPAGQGYTGAGPPVITLYRDEQARLARAANRAHAQLRAPGERAGARLKTSAFTV